MSAIKVGDTVEVVKHDFYVEGTALRDYPGFSEGSRHRVVKITSGDEGVGYHLVPENTRTVVAYAEEIKKV